MRVFDLNLNNIVNSRKCHNSSIFSITINKGQTKFYSLSSENKIKVWLLNNTFLHSNDTQNCLNEYKIPIEVKSVYNDSLILLSFIFLELSDNLVFLANKDTIYLYKMLSNLLKLDNKLSDSSSSLDNDLQEVELFSCSNVTTIELWVANYSCSLFAGCSDGKIHIFKLSNN